MGGSQAYAKKLGKLYIHEPASDCDTSCSICEEWKRLALNLEHEEIHQRYSNPADVPRCYHGRDAYERFKRESGGVVELEGSEFTSRIQTWLEDVE